MNFVLIFFSCLFTWAFMKILLRNIAFSRLLHVNDCALIQVDLRTISKKYSVFFWQQRWDNWIYGRHLYSLFPHVNITSWLTNCCLRGSIIWLIKCNNLLLKINTVSRPSYTYGGLHHRPSECHHFNSPFHTPQIVYMWSS